MNPVDTVPIDDLRHVFGWTEAVEFPAKYRALLLSAWEMAADDCTLRYVFRNLRPARHLEFGTWLGDGVLRCAEECDATVWTINLPEGESLENGEWAYSTLAEGALLSGVEAADRLVTSVGTWVRTDAHGLIGRKYLGGTGKPGLPDLFRHPNLGYPQLPGRILRFGVHRRRSRLRHRRQRHQAGDQSGPAWRIGRVA